MFNRIATLSLAASFIATGANSAKRLKDTLEEADSYEKVAPSPHMEPKVKLI